MNQKKQILYFQHNGWWYEYFSGDSIEITGNTNFTFSPGEYRVYTDIKLDQPVIQNTLNIEEYQLAEWETTLFPNPVNDLLQIEVKDCKNQEIKFSIINPQGKLMMQEIKSHSELYSFDLQNLKSGNYFILIEQEEKIKLLKFLKR